MSAPTQHAVAADCLFDGTYVRRNAGVVIDGANIAAVLPRAELPSTLAVRTLPDGAWLAPGFIDVQVNGGGDVLFNDVPTVEGIRAIGAAHRKFGTTAFLPTLISDSSDKMKTALAAVQQLVDVEPAVLGIHLEGPFLSPDKPGVHALKHIRRPTEADAAMLTAPRRGVMLVTLAPERVPAGFVRRLVGAGVRVSLGHSMATYTETWAAMAEGMTGFTHLFNAMRPMESRDPGPIAAALESPGVWFGMIADGIHVDPAMLRLALRGAAQPILITDAMPPAGGTRAAFSLFGQDITLRGGRCVRGDGTLAGTALNMAAAVRNCVRLLGVPMEAALRFASTHPAAFLGLPQLGRLEPGCRADMVAVTPDQIEVLQTWVAGRQL